MIGDITNFLASLLCSDVKDEIAELITVHSILDKLSEVMLWNH